MRVDEGTQRDIIYCRCIRYTATRCIFEAPRSVIPVIRYLATRRGVVSLTVMKDVAVSIFGNRLYKISLRPSLISRDCLVHSMRNFRRVPLAELDHQQRLCIPLLDHDLKQRGVCIPAGVISLRGWLEDDKSRRPDFRALVRMFKCYLVAILALLVLDMAVSCCSHRRETKKQS